MHVADSANTVPAAFPEGWAATAMPGRPLAKDADGALLGQLADPLHLPLPRGAEADDAAAEWLPAAKSTDILAARRAAPAPPSAMRAPGAVMAGLDLCVQVTFRCDVPGPDVVHALQDAHHRVRAAVEARERVVERGPSGPAPLSFGVPAAPPALPPSPRRGLPDADPRSPGAATHRTMGAYQKLVALGEAATSAVPALSSLSMDGLKTVSDGVRWQMPPSGRNPTPPSSLYVRAFSDARHAGGQFVDVTLTLSGADNEDGVVTVTSHMLDFSSPGTKVPAGVVVDPFRSDVTMTVGFMDRARVAVAVNGVLVDVVRVPEFPVAPRLVTVLRTSHTRRASLVVVRNVEWARVDPPPPHVCAALLDRRVGFVANDAFVATFHAGADVMAMSMEALMKEFVESPSAPLARLGVRRVVVMTPVRSQAASAKRSSQKRSAGETVTAGESLALMTTGGGLLLLLFVTHGDVSGFLDTRRKLSLFQASRELLSLPVPGLRLKQVSSIKQAAVSMAVNDTSCPQWTTGVTSGI